MLSATGRSNHINKPLVVQFSAPGYDLRLGECQPYVPGLSETLTGSTLIRNTPVNSSLYIFQEYLSEKPAKEDVQHPYPDYEDVDLSVPHVASTKISRRRDFLHLSTEAVSEKTYSTVFPASDCVIEQSFPFELLQFGLLIPAIIHKFEIMMLADTLSNTVLKNVNISNQSLLATAISASSAREETNYQRLEFYGDTLLKFCTSVQLTAKFLMWPEGYLSKQKDRLSKSKYFIYFFIRERRRNGMFKMLSRYGVQYDMKGSHLLKRWPTNQHISTHYLTYLSKTLDRLHTFHSSCVR
jgi:hypothetical protein